MAGIFHSLNDIKSGPGIPKNAPTKPRIIVFFDIFFRKFWHLVKLNMLFLVFNLPVIVGMPFISQFFLPMLNKNGGSIGNSVYELAFYFAASAIFVCIPIVTVGPVQAGFTYVLRNFAREEHAFLWGDFKEHALGNARQSIFICLIDLVVVLVIGMDINFYFGISRDNIFLTAMTFSIMLLLLLYLMMHMYIYPMLVTFRLSVKQIYKNAFIFSIIRFLPNLGILVLCFILAAFPLLLFPTAGVLLFFLVTMSTIGLITNFYVYPILKKYMMDKIVIDRL
ncbi:putative membrane protein YesL [Anaerosolibacter carboniphilus]|uniref:Putative membrane protein YesL n=1 Tax=Anaerosolibacter carboniphilus TaxID=1417629 RepID=A0A841KZ24_9FIRM|nr:DUF624 domain-containing protein [Anaerosolibacter carboniphilus]MBB6215389.1 putative membrane protein YesL [Anaerosolibacter carboniphilus]